MGAPATWFSIVLLGTLSGVASTTLTASSTLKFSCPRKGGGDRVPLQLTSCAAGLLHVPTQAATGKPSGVNGLDKLYVIHYAPLTERKKRMDALFQKQGMTATWLDSFGREAVTDPLEDCLFDQDFPLWGRASRGGPQKRVQKLKAYKSHIWSNLAMFADIVRNNHSASLVVEDDPAFRTAGVEDNLKEELEHAVDCANQQPGGWDLYWVGGINSGFLISHRGASKMLAQMSTANSHPYMYNLVERLMVQGMQCPNPIQGDVECAGSGLREAGCTQLDGFDHRPKLWRNGGKGSRGDHPGGHVDATAGMYWGEEARSTSKFLSTKARVCGAIRVTSEDMGFGNSIQ